MQSNMKFKYQQFKGVAIDIGAHRGLFCEPLLKQGITVIAFEPHPDQYAALLSLKAKYNTLIPLRSAVGCRGAVIVELTDYGNDGHSSSIFSRRGKKYRQGKTFKVPMIDLGEFLKTQSKVGLLKMNCEGAEVEMLLRCPDEQLQKCDQICAAFHLGKEKGMGFNQQQLDAIIARMKELGYTALKTCDRGPYYLFYKA